MNTVQPTPALAAAGGQTVLDSCPPTSARFSGAGGRLRLAWAVLSDVFGFPAFARMALIEAFLLAAYVATIAQPLIYGSVTKSFVALMTPVR
jgi:hypothetical protein